MNLYLIFIIIGIIFVICIISVLIKDILKEKADKKFNEELIDKGLLIQFKYFPIDGSKYGFCEYDSILQQINPNKFSEIINQFSQFKNIKSKNGKVINSYLQNKIYDITIWRKPFIDPNYYLENILNSVNYITNRSAYNIDLYYSTKIPIRLKEIDNYLLQMINNIEETPCEYVRYYNKNIENILDLKIPNIEKNRIYNLFKSTIPHFQRLPEINYHLGKNNLQKIINNIELKNIDLDKIYLSAIDEQKDAYRQIEIFLNKYEIEGKTIYDKINKYKNEYNLTQEDFIENCYILIDEINNFLREKKFSEEYLKKNLKLEYNNNTYWFIQEYIDCDRKKSNVVLFVKDYDNYNKNLYVNTIVHEYIHYMQYESDKNNRLSKYYNNVTTGEGVAYFFEDWVYNNNFLLGNDNYGFCYNYDNILRLTRYIVGYEIHVFKINYNEAKMRFKELSLYSDNDFIENELNWLITSINPMQYYIGKYMIKDYIKNRNSMYDVRKLLTGGSIQLKYLLK
jgi:hypothetical protein